MGFTCKQCGEEFEDRSTLGKHIHEHKRTAWKDEVDITTVGEVKKVEIDIAPDNVKKIVIPIEAAEELQWVAMDCPARLQVFGYRRKEGFVVEDVRYKP